MQRQAWPSATVTVVLLGLATYSVLNSRSALQVLGLCLLAVLSTKELVEVDLDGPVRIRGRFQPRATTLASHAPRRRKRGTTRDDAEDVSL